MCRQVATKGQEIDKHGSEKERGMLNPGWNRIYQQDFVCLEPSESLYWVGDDDIEVHPK